MGFRGLTAQAADENVRIDENKAVIGQGGKQLYRHL
jgi:hypothetical protein